MQKEIGTKSIFGSIYGDTNLKKMWLLNKLFFTISKGGMGINCRRN